MAENKLIILGSGIKFMSHLTIEAKAHIKQADKVLYLVNEPAMQEWIIANSKLSESLDDIYKKKEFRDENYNLIAEYIIENLKKINFLCVVIYGHPTVFVQPSLLAAKKASDLGYEVSILPGISSEDCLFADLKIDPATHGCQSFEATDFLLYQREYDSSSHLIIWQSFVIGILGIPLNHNPTNGLLLLKKYLEQKYDSHHEIILYEAAQYPIFRPRIDKIVLRDLPYSHFSPLTTLYVKPGKEKKPNIDMINAFKTLSS